MNKKIPHICIACGFEQELEPNHYESHIEACESCWEGDTVIPAPFNACRTCDLSVLDLIARLAHPRQVVPERYLQRALELENPEGEPAP